MTKLLFATVIIVAVHVNTKEGKKNIFNADASATKDKHLFKIYNVPAHASNEILIPIMHRINPACTLQIFPFGKSQKAKKNITKAMLANFILLFSACIPLFGIKYTSCKTLLIESNGNRV